MAFQVGFGGPER